MLIRAFITHKKAESFSDCQDRFAINKETKSIAVSDGMSQSVFQKYWAEILVEEYTSSCEWKPNLEAVRAISYKWKEKVHKVIETLRKEENNSAWRSERNINEGRSAGATFLGVRFKNNMEWVCDVLGDSCLILIRDRHIDKIITSEDVASFDNYPDYYDSNPEKTGKGTLKTEKGTFSEGNVILLVSDPFSDYLQKNKNSENERKLVDHLLSINSHEDFENMVEQWRMQGMHNDDSTLVIIQHDGLADFQLETIDYIDNFIKDEKALGKKEEIHQSENTSSDNAKLNAGKDPNVKHESYKDYIRNKLSDSHLKGQLNTILSQGTKKKKEKRKICKKIIGLFIRFLTE